MNQFFSIISRDLRLAVRQGGSTLLALAFFVLTVTLFPLGLGSDPSMMARVAPIDMQTEFFGLYALSGKATAFLGPAGVALFTETYQSQRAGMATIIAFFVVGLILMRKVPDIR